MCHVEANLGLSHEILGTLGLALGFINLAISIFEHALWVRKPHIGPRRGSLWVLSGGFGDCFGGLSRENVGATLVNLGLRHFCKVGNVDLTLAL